MPRLGILVALCLGLMGCGFHPLYGNAKLAPAMATIYVEPIPEAAGYELRNRLIDLLGSDGRGGRQGLSTQDHPHHRQPGRGVAE